MNLIIGLTVGVYNVGLLCSLPYNDKRLKVSVFHSE